MNFTARHSQEMYDMLLEIEETLKDKSYNKGNFQLALYEGFWLKFISELMGKIKVNSKTNKTAHQNHVKSHG